MGAPTTIGMRSAYAEWINRQKSMENLGIKKDGKTAHLQFGFCKGCGAPVKGKCDYCKEGDT